MRSFASRAPALVSALVIAGWAGWLAQPAEGQVAPGERYEAARAEEQRLFGSDKTKREEFVP